MPTERSPLAVWLWEHNMTQSELAASIGVLPSTVSRAVNGYVTAGMWAAFADAYGTHEARAILGRLGDGGRPGKPAEDKP